MKDVKEVIKQLAALLPVGTSISVPEAERRAGAFLAGMSTLINIRHEFTKEHIRLLTQQTVVYASLMAKGEAKTVTENKLNAEASPDYVEARENLEGVENDISFLKAHYDVFMAAHVFYRQMCRDYGGS